MMHWIELTHHFTGKKVLVNLAQAVEIAEGLVTNTTTGDEEEVTIIYLPGEGKRGGPLLEFVKEDKDEVLTKPPLPVGTFVAKGKRN